MLCSDLFPADSDFKVSPQWDTKNSHRRQVTIDIDSERFAVINSDFHNNKWSEPCFVILRAVVPVRELDLVADIVAKAKVVMAHIGRVDITKTELETLLAEL